MRTSYIADTLAVASLYGLVRYTFILVSMYLRRKYHVLCRFL